MMNTPTPETPLKFADEKDRAATIVAAYVARNTVPASKLPELIKDVMNAFSEATPSAPAATSASEPIMAEPVDDPVEDEEEVVEVIRPAVPINKSVTNDWIICLEDGKKFKSLKRHLRTKYNLSPEEYKEKWGLPPDYPMTAPSYSSQRAALAREMGLGRKAPIVVSGRKGKTQPKMKSGRVKPVAAPHQHEDDEE